jgi:hypothetical protein
MSNERPIAPPPELVEQWRNDITSYEVDMVRAAQWGADQELEACCEWADETGWQGAGDELRAARRPKPPSLKEQALQALEALKQRTTDPSIVEPLRYALEALPDDRPLPSRSFS